MRISSWYILHALRALWFFTLSKQEHPPHFMSNYKTCKCTPHKYSVSIEQYTVVEVGIEASLLKVKEAIYCKSLLILQSDRGNLLKNVCSILVFLLISAWHKRKHEGKTYRKILPLPQSRLVWFREALHLNKCTENALKQMHFSYFENWKISSGGVSVQYTYPLGRMVKMVKEENRSTHKIFT